VRARQPGRFAEHAWKDSRAVPRVDTHILCMRIRLAAWALLAALPTITACHPRVSSRAAWRVSPSPLVLAPTVADTVETEEVA